MNLSDTSAELAAELVQLVQNAREACIDLAEARAIVDDKVDTLGYATAALDEDERLIRGFSEEKYAEILELAGFTVKEIFSLIKAY